MVVDPAPPIQFGLYRLLIAFVQHALRLQEIEDLKDALDLGKFDDRFLRRMPRRLDGTASTC